MTLLKYCSLVAAQAPDLQHSFANARRTRRLTFALLLQIHFVLLVSRQGKTRLAKWYTPYKTKEKLRMTREVYNLIINRPPKLCNFIEWKNYKLVYRRYASLYFIMAVDPEDNELITLEIIHALVESLDRYFGNVCELDLIFNFHKAYFILDELILSGELQETSKKNLLRVISLQDSLQEAPLDTGAPPKEW